MPPKKGSRPPKLWRKGRNGKAYGCWFVTLDDKDVNLRTKNAEIARGRLAEAVKGKRDFESDADAVAREMEPTAAQLAAPPPAPPPPAPIAELPIAAPPPPPAAAAPSPAPIVPELVTPSRETEERAEAEATNAAAAETSGSTSNGATADPVEPDAVFGPDVLDGMLQQAADAVVILQIELQAWIIKRRTGKIAPQVQPGSKLHELAGKAWVAQFKQWFPDIDVVPPWVIAVALPAFFFPVQMNQAKDPPPKEQPAAEAAPSSAAGAEPLRSV